MCTADRVYQLGNCLPSYWNSSTVDARNCGGLGCTTDWRCGYVGWTACQSRFGFSHPRIWNFPKKNLHWRLRLSFVLPTGLNMCIALVCDPAYVASGSEEADHGKSHQDIWIRSCVTHSLSKHTIYSVWILQSYAACISRAKLLEGFRVGV